MLSKNIKKKKTNMVYKNVSAAGVFCVNKLGESSIIHVVLKKKNCSTWKC